VFSIFLKAILKYLNGKLDSKVEYIVTFIHDLGGNPIEWEIRIWLEGIWMNVDEIEIIGEWPWNR